MANKYLGREDAPLGEELWKKLDEAMVAAARGQLAGRRLLHTEGPYGLGLKSIPLSDVNVDIRWKGFSEDVETAEQSAEEDTELDESVYPVEIHASGVIPVAVIRTGFMLGARDLASYEREQASLDLAPVAESAIALAAAEDDLVFHGSDTLGTFGLLNVPGAHTTSLTAWKKPGDAANDLIQAITELDTSGFHGPYTLALAPSRYNLLYRRYAQGNQTELEHIAKMITDGILKAPVLEDGGVLLAANTHLASIVLGQDMTIGFIGPDAGEYEFSISESLALWVRQPKAICVLQS